MRTRVLLIPLALACGAAGAQTAQPAPAIGQVGVARVLYGSDSAQGDNLRPRESWAAFRRLPLAEAELEQIARNVPPYMKQQRK